MTDASSAPAVPVTIHRGDYRPPEWQIPDIALDFALGIKETRVTAALSAVRAADAPAPLLLRGDGLTPAEVRVDGAVWNDWRMDGGDLIVDLGDRSAATVAVDTVIDPSANTQRSEERRVGKECVSPYRSRGSPYHSKTQHYTNKQAHYH